MESRPAGPDTSGGGNRGSFWLMLDTSRWRDFEAGRGGGATDLVKYLQGMGRPSALKWLQAQGYLGLRPSQDGTRSPKSLSLSADHRGLRQPPWKASKSTPSVIPWHCRAWGSARSIPLDPEHPARSWMAARKLWRPAIPSPGLLRWQSSDRRHTGAGNILALITLPATWTSLGRRCRRPKQYRASPWPEKEPLPLTAPLTWEGWASAAWGPLPEASS